MFFFLILNSVTADNLGGPLKVTTNNASGEVRNCIDFTC